MKIRKNWKRSYRFNMKSQNNLVNLIFIYRYFLVIGKYITLMEFDINQKRDSKK